MTIPRHILERQLEAYFRSKVRMALGGMAIKFTPTERGVPDRIVLLPGGRVYLVELKAEGGELSPIQRNWHGRAKALGVRVYVLTGREGIDRWIREVGSEYDPKERGPRKQKVTT